MTLVQFLSMFLIILLLSIYNLCYTQVENEHVPHLGHGHQHKRLHGHNQSYGGRGIHAGERGHAINQTMHLTTVLGSVHNNSEYYLFIPKQILFWSKFDIRFLVIFVGIKLPDELVPYSSNIILWSKNLDLSQAYVGQNIRLFYTALLKLEDHEMVMITDMDMLPCSPKFYKDGLETFQKHDFIYYRNIPDEKQIYMCYNAAHPSVWGHCFGISSESDIERKLNENYQVTYNGIPGSNGWFIDQEVMFKAVINYPHLKVLNRQIRRLEMSMFREHLQKGESNFFMNYDDAHFHRSFSHNKDLIEDAERQLFSLVNGKNIQENATGSAEFVVTAVLPERGSPKQKVTYPGGFIVVKDSPSVERTDGDEARKYIVDKLRIDLLCKSQPNLIIFDVGGLNGDFGLYTSKLSCRTVIFEPQQSSAQNIANSIALNGYESVCKVMNVAVSLKNSTFFGVSDGTPVVALDNILLPNEIVLLLKIDVEGLEGKVLASAKRILTEGRVRHIIFEYTPKQFEDRGTNYKDLLPLMSRIGFKVCYALNRHKEIIYRIKPSDYELFFSIVKSISMQTDVYCSFIDSNTFDDVENWTEHSAWF